MGSQSETRCCRNLFVVQSFCNRPLGVRMDSLCNPAILCLACPCFGERDSCLLVNPPRAIVFR